jgi:hypothetical protein
MHPSEAGVKRPRGAFGQLDLSDCRRAIGTAGPRTRPFWLQVEMFPQPDRAGIGHARILDTERPGQIAVGDGQQLLARQGVSWRPFTLQDQKEKGLPFGKVFLKLIQARRVIPPGEARSVFIAAGKITQLS